MATRTQKLKEAGQSLWLDNIQRRELHDGTLQRMIETDGICGITSNPTIFMNAVSKSTDYDAQILALTRQGMSSRDIYTQITIADVRDAARILLPVFEATRREDGFVSIELNPQLAFQVAESIQEARQLTAAIGLPNIMVKVPGTKAGLAVLRQLITEGINVNVTLLFSPQRYRDVAQTYIQALEQRLQKGGDIAPVRSVASFFISRIDTRVDGRIDALAGSNSAAKALRGQAAVQGAKVAYGIFRELFLAERFQALERRGGRLQRLLWASTGTKDPAYSDVKYVEELIASQTINTLPPKTIDAFRDHGAVNPAIDAAGLENAPEILRQLEQAGIDLKNIYDGLEDEGVKAFETSYLDLLRAIDSKAQSLSG